MGLNGSFSHYDCMSAVDVVRSLLSPRSELVVTATATSVAVKPADKSGFPIELIERGPASWTVYFDGWHEEFGSEREALSCVAFGLSEECRLRVEKRGETPVKWTVESREGGTWIADSEVGLFRPFFWRARSVEYRSTHVFPTRRPPAT